MQLTEKDLNQITDFSYFEINDAEFRRELEHEFEHLDLICSDLDNNETIINEHSLVFQVYGETHKLSLGKLEKFI